MIRLLSLYLLFFTGPLHAQFRDAQDFKITAALIGQFQRDCSHKVNVDQSKIIELQEVFEKVRTDKTPVGEKSLQCYQDRMSQIIGINQLYKELCDEVSRDASKRAEQDTLRLLLMTQRYRKNIGPFHDLLNDCLIEKGAGKYLVRSLRQKSETSTLRQELESMEVKAPFEANRAEFR